MPGGVAATGFQLMGQLQNLHIIRWQEFEDMDQTTFDHTMRQTEKIFRKLPCLG